MDFYKIKLSSSPLDLNEVYSSVVLPSCGAISMFLGTTRDHFEGKKVVQLEYEAYEAMAIKALENIAVEAKDKFGISKVAIYHRLGVVPVGEASVIIAVSSTHREASLKAVSFLIDSLKAQVPIFKKEIYSDSAESQWKENVECVWSSGNLHDDEPILEYVEGVSSSSNDLVQITAGAQEINRRIALFMKRKRQQADLENLQDFCFHGLPIVEKESSCARVDAQLIRHKDSNSHLKVHRVENVVGPQVQENSFETAKVDCEGTEERIKNAEMFLGLGKNSSLDVFSRLKAIEDRILYLETISPEYFKLGKELEGQQQEDVTHRATKITQRDIEEKMQGLERQLLDKYGVTSSHL